MDTAEKGPFNQSQHPWYRPRTLALPLPLIAYRNGRLTIDASEMASSCAVSKCLSALFHNTLAFANKINLPKLHHWLSALLGCTSSAGCKCLDIARTATSTGPWGSIDSVMNVKVRSPSCSSLLLRLVMRFTSLNSIYNHLLIFLVNISLPSFLYLT